MHFAVSNSEVHMTTRLDGPATRFLPFNKGDDGGKGNPPNPNGHPTSYLWEEVWARDSWLEILGRYIVAEKDDEEADHEADLPALSPARRHAEARGGGAGRGRGRQIPDPALGRLGQDQLDRLDRAFPRRPARRQEREAVLDGASSCPTAM